jgi:hypothetical protein
VIGATVVAAAGPTDSDRRALRAKLLTAPEFAGASTRTGWHVRRDPGQFDCDALRQTRDATVRVRRDFSSDADATGLEHASRFRTVGEAREAFAAVKTVVRACDSSSEGIIVRVVRDEAAPGPGHVRVIQVFFRNPEAGSDTHSFGVIRHQRKVAVVHLGEMGRTPVKAFRGTVTLAADKLAGRL